MEAGKKEIVPKVDRRSTVAGDDSLHSIGSVAYESPSPSLMRSLSPNNNGWLIVSPRNHKINLDPSWWLLLHATHMFRGVFAPRLPSPLVLFRAGNPCHSVGIPDVIDHYPNLFHRPPLEWILVILVVL